MILLWEFRSKVRYYITHELLENVLKLKISSVQNSVDGKNKANNTLRDNSTLTTPSLSPIH